MYLSNYNGNISYFTYIKKLYKRAINCNRNRLNITRTNKPKQKNKKDMHKVSREQIVIPPKEMHNSNEEDILNNVFSCSRDNSAITNDTIANQ